MYGGFSQDTTSVLLPLKPSDKYRARHAPTGEVFIEGGVKNPNDDATAVKHGELFDPVTSTWKVLPEAERPRQYHSVSLLMPDGAVWVAGSNFGASPGLANARFR